MCVFPFFVFHISRKRTSPFSSSLVLDLSTANCRIPLKVGIGPTKWN